MNKITRVKCKDCGKEYNKKGVYGWSGICRKCKSKKTITHGLSRTRFHNIYRCMNNRCNNVKERGYKNYGGKGIKVERTTFEEFRDDMYNSYLEHAEIYGEKNTSLDRYPDRSGNYCKDNCRWATKKEQDENKDGRIYIEYKGEQKLLRDVGRELGIPTTTIYDRWKKGDRDNIIIGEKQNSKFIIIQGIKNNIKGRAKLLGISKHVSYNRMQRGQDIKLYIEKLYKNDSME